MATVKFWQGMTKASTVLGVDKMMIGKNETGEALYIDFDQAKQFLDITSNDLPPLDGGNTQETALVVIAGPLGQSRRADVVSGKWYNFGSGAIEATADRFWKAYWDGYSWFLVNMGALPNNSAKAPDWTPGTYDKNMIVIFENVLYRANKQTSAAPVTGGATNPDWDLLSNDPENSLPTINQVLRSFVNASAPTPGATVTITQTHVANINGIAVQENTGLRADNSTFNYADDIRLFTYQNIPTLRSDGSKMMTIRYRGKTYNSTGDSNIVGIRPDNSVVSLLSGEGGGVVDRTVDVSQFKFVSISGNVEISSDTLSFVIQYSDGGGGIFDPEDAVKKYVDESVASLPDIQSDINDLMDNGGDADAPSRTISDFKAGTRVDWGGVVSTTDAGYVTASLPVIAGQDIEARLFNINDGFAVITIRDSEGVYHQTQNNQLAVDGILKLKASVSGTVFATTFADQPTSYVKVISKKIYLKPEDIDSETRSTSVVSTKKYNKEKTNWDILTQEGEELDKTILVQGYYMNSSGTVLEGGLYDYLSGYIPVFKGTNISALTAGYPEQALIAFYLNQTDPPEEMVYGKAVDALQWYDYSVPEDGFVRVGIQASFNASFYDTFRLKGIYPERPKAEKYNPQKLYDELAKGGSGTDVKVGSKFSIGHIASLIRLDYSTSGVLPTEKGTVITGVLRFQHENIAFEKECELEVQGSTSAAYPKKNWTFSFVDFELSLGGLVHHDAWVFKSNWIDATHVRNIGSNRLWESMVQTRDTYPLREVDYSYIGKAQADSFDTKAIGHVDGFPAELYVNGAFYGMGCFNIGKKRVNYNMSKSNKAQIQLAADDHVSLKSFNPAGWELRNPSLSGYEEGGPIEDATVMASINRLWTFNNSTAVNFRANFTQFYNLINVIDYNILFHVLLGTDIIDKNFILSTWDGNIWHFMPYDLDTTFGLFWNGSTDYPTNQNTYTGDFVQSGTKQFWDMFEAQFMTERQERYRFLRENNILTVNNVFKITKELERTFGQPLYKQEQVRWPDIPSKNFATYPHLINWFKGRLTYTDTLFSYTG